jgi:endonuclease/exonuclease/phosphatase family metal-dependent hydrolase
MKHLISHWPKLAIITLFIFLSFSYPENEKLAVMTFNIRYDNPDDGMFSWDARKGMVFWLIEKYDPDIMGIQEALKGQMDELSVTLSDYQWSGVGRDDGQEQGEYVPIFYKTDRFTLLDAGHFWLSDKPEEPGSMGWDAACTRMVSWIKLSEISKGVNYFIFNTHFDHVGEEARINSARLLKDNILQIAGNDPVIVMGDFNCRPDSEPMQVLSQFLLDSRSILEEGEASLQTTFVGFPADLSGNKIIDHIFVSSHFNANAYEIIADNANGFFPSDHLAVQVNLSLKMP